MSKGITIEELVQATLIIGARRANPELTHGDAFPLIEKHIKGLSSRFKTARHVHKKSKPVLSYCCNAPIWKVMIEKEGNPGAIETHLNYICEKCQKQPAVSPEAIEHMKAILEGMKRKGGGDNSQ